jgi:hypothetical protein
MIPAPLERNNGSSTGIDITNFLDDLVDMERIYRFLDTRPAQAVDHYGGGVALLVAFAVLLLMTLHLGSGIYAARSNDHLEDSAPDEYSVFSTSTETERATPNRDPSADVTENGSVFDG